MCADPVDEVDPVVNEVVGASPVVTGSNVAGNNAGAVLPNAGASDDLGALVPAGLAAMVVGGALMAAGRRKSQA